MDHQETIRQLGGAGRLKMMVGAENFVGSEKALSFKFTGSEKFSHVRISLNEFDAYGVEFMKIRGTKILNTETLDMVYADQLVEVFESKTGLYLSL